MWHNAKNRQLKYFVWLIIGMVVLSISISAGIGLLQSKAQEPVKNMQMLLVKAKERAPEGVWIKFAIPVIGEEHDLLLGDPQDTEKRHISDIGNDYVCFGRLAGQAAFTDCTPFSNIVAIRFGEN